MSLLKIINAANAEIESDADKILRYMQMICPHCNTGDLKIIEYEPARFKIRCDNCLDEWVADYAKQ